MEINNLNNLCKGAFKLYMYFIDSTAKYKNKLTIFFRKLTFNKAMTKNIHLYNIILMESTSSVSGQGKTTQDYDYDSAKHSSQFGTINS